MARRPTLSPLLCTLVAAFALTACGGGGDSTPTIDPAQSITGTAAAGAPIVGNVTVRDSLGAQKTVLIAADGSYTVDVSDMTGPFQFRAVGKVGGRDVALSSVATADDVGKTINITPFTDLIVANVVGKAVDDFLSGDDFARLTTAELNAARDTLTQRLLPILQEFGVADSFDLLRSAFTANRTQFDAVMDVVQVSVDPATNKAVIRDLINKQQIEDDLASKADATVIPAPAEGSLSGAVTDLQQVDAVLTAMTALFATQVPAEDNAQLLALLHEDFLENGLTLAEFLTPDEMPEQGSKLHSPKIVERAANGDLLVAWEYVGPDGSEAVEWYFRKDDAGKWRILGNQRLAGMEIAPINERHQYNGNALFKRYLELWIESAQLSIQAAKLTGPGIDGPGSDVNEAIFLKRSSATPEANFDIVGGSGSWIPACDEQPAPCVDFSEVGSDATYTVQLLDADNKPVGAPIPLTLQRAPVSNADAQANASKWFASFTVAPQSFSALTDGTNIVYSWTAPSDSAYRIQNLGFSSASNWFSEDVDGSATSAAVGTWQGPAPSAAPNTWIHVVGPYDRRFVSTQQMQ